MKNDKLLNVFDRVIFPVAIALGVGFLIVAISALVEFIANCLGTSLGIWIKDFVLYGISILTAIILVLGFSCIIVAIMESSSRGEQ